MQTTFSNGLSPAFKGKEIVAGFPVYVANGGTRTLGGTIAAENTNVAYIVMHHYRRVQMSLTLERRFSFRRH